MKKKKKNSFLLFCFQNDPFYILIKISKMTWNFTRDQLKLPWVGKGNGGSPSCWNADAGVKDATDVILGTVDAETVVLMPTAVCVPPDAVVAGVSDGLGVTAATDVAGVGAETGVCGITGACCWPGFTSLPKMLLSDICSRWLTGGTRAKVAGSRLTSCFISLSNSSSWFNTETDMFST